MVLFKRKPVQFLPKPPINDDDTECWIIPETQELFTSYESYLQRMDWYKSKKFICEISGHSGLSFFDALKSEAQGAKEVDSAFPEPLKEPVLRRVQFSTISRIDSLVDKVFDDFKHDFYPGEMVVVHTDETSRESGVIRDKAKFPEIRSPSGEVTREAFSRYFVKLVERNDGTEMLVDDQNVSRDRKVFTKQMLRQFLKNTITREAWNGAPWLVKQQYAEWYRIDTDVPPHLQWSNRQAEKKEKRKSEQDSMFAVWQHKLPELKPALKGKKRIAMQEQLQALQQAQYEEYRRTMQADPKMAAHGWPPFLPVSPAEVNGFPHVHEHHPTQLNGHNAQIQLSMMPPQQPVGPPSPPPIKYPIEDLDIHPTLDGTHRPALKFATESQNVVDAPMEDLIVGLAEKNVGLLLEVWNTLTVYCQVLQLDSFTFDDFVESMQFSSDELTCELFEEMHCAILKQLVNGENEQHGAIQISLPDLPDPEESEEEEEEDESRPPTPTPPPDVPARRTRASLNKQIKEDVKAKSPTPEDAVPHRAADMFDPEYGWVERLRKRDFRNGGWQLVVVGLLHQLSGRERLQLDCERILTHLAPLDAEPSIETARIQYGTLDINLRTQTLQILCHLFLETKTVKNFLEEMSNTMTQFRKVKIEHQRSRKEAAAKLKLLYEERRLLAPAEKSPTPPPELEDTMDMDRNEQAIGSGAETEDEEILTSRSLRRGQDRALERKRKREEEVARKEKAKEEKQTKGSKEYQRVLKAIEKERERIEEHEEQIEIVDSDLREADCARTRILGKDRFCNRYWWFERNAMPYGGLPDSSTADADYANGRLWIQGPDEMERAGFIDVTDDVKNDYLCTFDTTPSDRKKLEEGSTSLHTATQWGFLDTPEALDELIAWLDGRGHRELKLKKELIVQRDIIVKYMENRKAWLANSHEVEEPTTRMSTRTKTYVGDNAPRCLKWRNTAALDELGHRHIDPPPKPRGGRGRKNDVVRIKDAANSQVTNRQGKPVTRQGTRYYF